MTQECCAGAGVTVDTFTPDNLVVGDHIQTHSAYITPGVAYARGDLLTYTPATNMVAPAAAGTIANAKFISVHTLTALEATDHAATGHTLDVYCHGEYNDSAVSVEGVLLTDPQKIVATGALAPHIQLRKVI